MGTATNMPRLVVGMHDHIHAANTGNTGTFQSIYVVDFSAVELIIICSITHFIALNKAALSHDSNMNFLNQCTRNTDILGTSAIYLRTQVDGPRKSSEGDPSRGKKQA